MKTIVKKTAIEITHFCGYCGSSNCDMLVGGSVCANAELGAAEPDFYADPNPAYKDGVLPTDGFSSIHVAKASGVPFPKAWKFVTPPSMEVLNILAVRSVWHLPKKLAELKKEYLTSTILVKKLTGLEEPQHKAQNLLAYMPGAETRQEPPMGYEYENTGNYVPGGLWTCTLPGGRILQEHCEWLDG